MGIDGSELRRRKYQKNMAEKNKAFWYAILGLMLLVIYAAIAWGDKDTNKISPIAKRSSEQSQKVDRPPVGSGEASIQIGQQSISFGSTNQAAELLKLIEQQPGKDSYQITYSTDTDTVVFGCVFSKNIMVRMHTRHDQHGSVERWNGWILDRLITAVGGGSLNDTPVGKMMVAQTSF